VVELVAAPPVAVPLLLVVELDAAPPEPPVAKFGSGISPRSTDVMSSHPTVLATSDTRRPNAGGRVIIMDGRLPVRWREDGTKLLNVRVGEIVPGINGTRCAVARKAIRTSP
jgi:hypothetical protein